MSNSSNPNNKITITGDRKYLERTRELINDFFNKNGLDDIEASIVEMAIMEACHNAIYHGSKKEEQALFNLELSVDNRMIKAIITDRGKAIDFDNIEPFNINQDFLAYKNGGLGIPLVKALMDEVNYKRKSNNTNELTLIKQIRHETEKGRK